jgi:Uma2 family endonuclease
MRGPPYVPVVKPALISADDLLRAHFPDRRVELVRGVLVLREPPGFRHGRVTTELGARLMDWVRTTGTGRLITAEVGFKLASDPDIVRAPDLAFIAHERLPERDSVGYPALAPDLVVEVLSPADRAGEVLAKVVRLPPRSGRRLAWVVIPSNGQKQIPRSRTARARSG